MAQAKSSNLTVPLAPTPADVVGTIGAGVPQQPDLLQQILQTGRQIVRDIPGTVVGFVKQTVEDVKLVSNIMPWELDDAALSFRLRHIGYDPEKLRPLAEANMQRLASQGLLSEDREEAIRMQREAGQRLVGLTLGFAAGSATGAIVGPGLATAIPSTIGAHAATGAMDMLAFGTVSGALNPVEEGQSRLNNAITSAVISAPLGAVGGTVSGTIARILSRKGIKPELEAPEIVPDIPANPLVSIRKGGALIQDVLEPGRAASEAFARSEIALGGRFTEGAREALARRRAPGRMEQAAAQVADRGSVEAAARAFEERAKANAVHGGIKRLFERRDVSEILGREIKKSTAEPIHVGNVSRTMAEILERNDRLGFDTVSEAANSIIRNSDWRYRWEVSDMDAIFVEKWRSSVVERLPKLEEEAIHGLRKQQGITLEKGGAAPSSFEELVALPAGAPEILGGKPGQLPTAELPSDIAARAAALADLQARVADKSMQAVLDKISVGKTTVRRPFDWNQFYTRYLDDLHPINVATKDLLKLQGEIKLEPGFRLPGIDDPYVLARLTRGSVGKANTFLESGTLDFKTLQPIGPGLREVLRPVVQSGQLDPLRAYLISRRTIELGKRGKATPIPAEEAQAVVANVESGMPNVVEAAARLDTYQAQLLKYLQDSGLLSAEQVKAMQELNQSYIPFYRVIEDLGDGPPAIGGPNVSGSRMANLTSGIRRLKGSELFDIVDPLESVVKNTYAFVRLADRQAVADALVRLAETAPEQTIVQPTRLKVKAIEVSPQEMQKAQASLKQVLVESGADPLTVNMLADDMMTIFRPSERLPDGVFWVVRDGQRKYFKVDNDLWRSMLQLDRESSNMLIRLLSVPSRVLRGGATLSLQFIARNPLRDQFTAGVFSRYGYKPGYDLTRGVFNMVHGVGEKANRAFESFRRSGGEHATLVRTTAAERRALQHELDAIIREDGFFADAFRTVRGPRGWLEGLRRLSETMEEATRMGEFQRALAATGDPRLAGYAAREVVVDFSRIGTQMRAVNQITAFFNANVQGLDKAVRAFRANPGKAGAMAVGTITVPTVLLYLVNHDDPNYTDQPEWLKDSHWLIPQFRWNDAEGRLEKTGDFLRIPKPFDLGLIFGASIERVLRWIKDNDPQAFYEFAQNVFNTMTPPMLPAAVRPTMEVMRNKVGFTGRPIVPAAQREALPEDQIGIYTGPVARALGRVFNTSPRYVEHFIRGHTGGLGMGALEIADKAIAAVGISAPPMAQPIRESDKWPVIGPLVRAFTVEEPTISSQTVERFYRVYEQLQAVDASFNLAIRGKNAKRARAIAEGMPVEMAMWPNFEKTGKAMTEIRRSMNTIRTMTDEELLSNERALARVPEEVRQRGPMAIREHRIRQLGITYRKLAAGALRGWNRVKEHLEAPPPAAQPLGQRIEYLLTPAKPSQRQP